MIRRLLPYVLAAIVLAAGFASLHQYNVTWDEGLGDLFFGQRYLSFFTTFDFKYLDFGADPYPPGYRPDLRSAPFRYRPWEHYPLASTLATISSRLFSGLGLLDPFDGYHAFNLLFGAAFLVIIYKLLERCASTLAALSTTFLLFLSPRIVAALMANVKDFSEMILFTMAAAAFGVAIERASPRLMIGSGVLLGLALAAKANAFFVPPVIGVYFLLRGVPASWKGRGRALTVWLFASFALSVVVLFALWPYLWSDPINAIYLNLRYIALRKSQTPPSDQTNPFAMIGLTTPLPFLIALVTGSIPLIRGLRRRDPFAALATSIILVICGRLAVPSAINFDGVRHFLELFPAMAAVGGLGVASLAQALSRAIKRTTLAAALTLTAFTAPVVAAEVHVHPFETAYWNEVAGGLPGAMKRDIPQAGDYWAGSYRLGLRWLNAHAEPHSLLAVPIAEHTVRIVAPYRLRSDITLVHLVGGGKTPISADALARFYDMSFRHPCYVMFILRRDWANQLVYDSMDHFQNVALWQVDGAPVLAIYKVAFSRPGRGS